MNKGPFIHIICWSFLVVAGCIDPYETEVEQGPERLVVIGRITNLEESYFVTLSNSGNYSQQVDGLSSFITGATVTIMDENGGCVELYERETGRYYSRPGEYKGEIGMSYFVDIILPSGKHVRSEPERMLQPPEISRVYYEYNPGSELERRGFYVYVDTNDPENQNNYYKWETVSWWLYSWDPCWNRVPDFQPFNILSDQKINGNRIEKRFMKVVPYNSRQPYVVTVNQMALNENAYDFLDRVNDQLNLSGSIFDPPPTFIRGNLYNVDDPDDIVLGYFYTAGVATHEVAVDRTIPEESPRSGTPILNPPLYCGDPCDWRCVAFAGGQCGLPPCPPECNDLPNVTYKPPKSWPRVEIICDE